MNTSIRDYATNGSKHMVHVKKHLDLLGMKVRDRVTRFSGVVDSISFDLYGCIQASVNGGMDKEGKLGTQSYWFDVSRLETLGKRVMDAPEFDFTPEQIAEGWRGPAVKPGFVKP